MAKLPTRERLGRTIATGISIDQDVYNSIKKYAKENSRNFSSAIEFLSRLGLAEELKKKDTFSQNLLERRKAS